MSNSAVAVHRQQLHRMHVHVRVVCVCVTLWSNAYNVMCATICDAWGSCSHYHWSKLTAFFFVSIFFCVNKSVQMCLPIYESFRTYKTFQTASFFSLVSVRSPSNAQSWWNRFLFFRLPAFKLTILSPGYLFFFSTFVECWCVFGTMLLSNFPRCKKQKKLMSYLSLENLVFFNFSNYY